MKRERNQKQWRELQEANRSQRKAADTENGKNESIISKLEQLGEVLRNSITKMSDNPLRRTIYWSKFLHVRNFFFESFNRALRAESDEYKLFVAK